MHCEYEFRSHQFIEIMLWAVLIFLCSLLLDKFMHSILFECVNKRSLFKLQLLSLLPVVIPELQLCSFENVRNWDLDKILIISGWNAVVISPKNKSMQINEIAYFKRHYRIISQASERTTYVQIIIFFGF